MARQGTARPGKARPGSARQGLFIDFQGKARLGSAK